MGLQQVHGCRHRRVHAHGTTATYHTHRCRCQACSDAQYRYEKRWRRDFLAGVGGRLIPADDVVAHVQALRAARITVRTIAEQADCSPTYVYDLVNHRYALVRADVAARIMALHPTRCVTVTGVIRRVQALFAAGWTTRSLMGAIAEQTGTTVAHSRLLWLACHSTPKTLVNQATLDAIAKAYDKLAIVDPVTRGVSPLAAANARQHAVSCAWAPPLAWDDDTIDDPAAIPQGIRDPTIGRSVAEIEDDLLELAHDGIPFRVAATRMGYTNSESLRRALYRHAMYDVLEAYGVITRGRPHTESLPLAA